MQVQSLVLRLAKEIILQKVQTFKCLTIDVSGQKEVVMALLPQKKQFQTVTMLYGLVFTSQIVDDSFKKVLKLLCNFSCTITYQLHRRLNCSNTRHKNHFIFIENQARDKQRSNTCFLQNQESLSR